ncbi:MAG: ATP-binding cassette domain-containing protein [Elusimicrobia bacterium]|nr:ATP-binding cassette domain-containing protein [Elusimicrobiota bacterium]
MITIRNAYKEFGYQTLLKNASLQINEEDRYALVGPNGSGKSTLFKLILGKETLDKGEIHLRKGIRIGYLPQEQAIFGDGTVLSETLSGHEDLDGRLAAKAKSILAGLGFNDAGFEKKISQLSGGWAMRVAIARLLLEEPDALLLDEPTNHLDLESTLWLQEYLCQFQGAIFLITHDRTFLNTICQAVVSVLDHDLNVYWGAFEDFIEARDREKEKLESAYKLQQKQISDMEDFIARNLARLSTASRAQSMKKRLEKLERIELPREMKPIRINFPQPKRTAARVLTLNNVDKSYGDVKVYQGLDFAVERGWKMAFVGHNGAGKSTLLKMLAGVIPIDSGERALGLNAKVGYYSQYRLDMLNPNRTVFQEASDNTQFGQTETFIRTVLGTFLFPGETVFKKVNVLSGGEKSRLALVKLLLDPPNVLLMDEPTTHLDMSSVEALIDALKNYDGTVCFISHDVYFINQLATHVVHVDGGRVSIYPGNYEYFEHRQKQIREEADGKITQPERLPESASGVNPKLARQQKAQEREFLRLKEKQAVEAVQIKKRVEELTAQMHDPVVYADYMRARAVGDEIKSLQRRLAELESEERA